MKISVQAYTLREYAGSNMTEVIEKLKSFGYDGVELAGYGNLSSAALKEVLDAQKLTVSSMHVGYDLLTDGFDTLVKDAELFGVKTLILPGYDLAGFDEDRIEETASSFNAIMDKLEAHGIKLGFHNHDGEFTNGRFDRLMSHCPRLLVELDTYWVTFAGADPLAVMEQYKDRLVYIHIKDMVKGEKPDHGTPNPNILEGCIDIKAIMDKAAALGVEWAVVEMDQPTGEAYAAVDISRQNLRTIGY